MATYQTYQDAAEDYMARFNELMDIPPGASPTATRGAGDVPVEALIERAEAIADVSSGMTELAQPYVTSDDATLREAISNQMIAQAAAEMQLAAELLAFAAEEEEGAVVRTRAVRSTALREAIGELEKAMITPLSAGLPVSIETRAGEEAQPTTPEDAKKALQEAIELTLHTITQGVTEKGGQIAFDLLFKTEWTKVVEGALMTHDGAKEQLEKLKEEADGVVERAIGAAQRTLLNVYDKILTFFDSEAGQVAREKVKEWLEEIEKEGKIEVLATLIGKFYRVDPFNEALQGWMAESEAPTEKLNETTAAVSALSEKFLVMTGQAANLVKTIGYAKMVPLPAVLLVVASIQVSLLATLIYAGYDYVGYKQVDLLDITKGVAQVVQENLGVPA